MGLILLKIKQSILVFQFYPFKVLCRTSHSHIPPDWTPLEQDECIQMCLDDLGFSLSIGSDGLLIQPFLKKPKKGWFGEWKHWLDRKSTNQAAFSPFLDAWDCSVFAGNTKNSAPVVTTCLLAFTAGDTHTYPWDDSQCLAFPCVRTCLKYAFSFLTYIGQCRKTALHPGCIPVEGNIPQHHPKKEQHGFWIHHHWWRWAWRVSAGEKCDSGWACSAGWENGNR